MTYFTSRRTFCERVPRHTFMPVCLPATLSLAKAWEGWGVLRENFPKGKEIGKIAPIRISGGVYRNKIFNVDPPFFSFFSPTAKVLSKVLKYEGNKLVFRFLSSFCNFSGRFFSLLDCRS